MKLGSWVPVKLDGYTANRSKLHQANMCVEMDVSKSLPSHLWVKVMDKGGPVKVTYINVPHFFKYCKKLGHLENLCLAKEDNAVGNDPTRTGGNHRNGVREGAAHRPIPQ